MDNDESHRDPVVAGEGCPRATGPMLLLVRHGAVASHRGDIPLTKHGRAQAEWTGNRLAGLNQRKVEILVAPTRRARQTGRMIMHGMSASGPSTAITPPRVAMALRNPDLFLAGHRVELVSTAAAFAGQVPGVTEADVLGVEFFAGFLQSDDRIGYWVHHADPPGDDAAAVATRVHRFSFSLGNNRAGLPDVVVGVTHSPVLRALAIHYLGSDPGEPDYLHGYAVRPRADGSPDLEIVRCAPAESDSWQGGEQCRT